MSIIVFTPDPKGLLSAIKNAIDKEAGEKGSIDTWAYDKDGDFTHSPSQWNKEAWLRPHVGSGILQFGIVGKKGVAMTKALYGVYHGRFIEMLETHFDDLFSLVTATAQKDAEVDLFK